MSGLMHLSRFLTRSARGSGTRECMSFRSRVPPRIVGQGESDERGATHKRSMEVRGMVPPIIRHPLEAGQIIEVANGGDTTETNFYVGPRMDSPTRFSFIILRLA